MKNTFKKTCLAVGFLLLTNFVLAQAPQYFSYQSVLRNSSNSLLANTQVGIKISVLQGSATGTAVYEETQTATTNANGLLSIQIGSGTADLTNITIPDSVTSIGTDAFTTGTFSQINWANGPYFIKTETDPTGGNNYSIVGTQQLLSVPYALYAAKSGGNAFETTAYPTDIHNTNPGNVGIGTDLPSEKLDVSGNVRVRDNLYVEGPITFVRNLDVNQNLAVNGNNTIVGNSDVFGTTTANSFVKLGGQANEFLMADGSVSTGTAGPQGATGLPSGTTGQTLRYNGTDWVANSTLYNDGSTIGVGTSTPNAETSLDIATQLPVLFPSMTQTQINNIAAPVEGMVQFNTDAHKLQVYAMLTNNASILNEIYLGTEAYEFSIYQNGISPIDGQIIAVELLLKDRYGSPYPFINMGGQGSFTVPSFGSFTWFTFVLPNPIAVSAGNNWSINFSGPGVYERKFATNSNYPNGSGCCYPGADDLLFRVHIQPNPGSYGWQNMH